MTIERANTEDSTMLTELTKQSKAFWGFSEETLANWSHLLTISEEYIQENSVFKLIENGEIIGYYSFIKIDEKTLKLDNLFISPKYIKHGFGSILMAHFLDQAKLLKIEKITLDAEPNAEMFHKKFGFITIGALESSIKNRFLPIMELKLGVEI